MRSTLPPPDIEYPDTDGQPMAENTIQAEVMMTLFRNFQWMFRHRDDVFIAIDLFWYPVKGRNDIRHAPDVMVAFGRPKGHRRSYKQWEEAGVAPQVVFEVVSDSNTVQELEYDKKDFYEQYGSEEYYIYNPDTGRWKERLLREQERQRAEQERLLREQAQAELERLKRLLRERGIEPEN